MSSSPPTPPFSSVDDAVSRLKAARYVTDRELAVAVFLAGTLGKPILLEGPAGVGKTELAKAVARATGRELVRLQCYEGLDEAKALYEWEYGKQLLYTQLVRDTLQTVLSGAKSVADAVDRIAAQESAFFHERFLLARPLLAAIRASAPVVLLVDEVDRSDPEFEALLLELLADFQITIPELGTIRAQHPPFVVLTSNATREVTEALRRRCLHVFLDFPVASRELEIVKLHVPEAADVLAQQVVKLASAARALDLRKPPSTSEVVEWTRSLVLLGADALTPELVRETLAVLSKHREDSEKLAEQAATLVRKAAEG